MKTRLIILLGAVLLTACHHNDRRDDRRSTPDYRRNTPTYRSDDGDRRMRVRRESDHTPYRQHRSPGYASPIGMYWNCPTEPQMLGYVTR